MCAGCDPESYTWPNTSSNGQPKLHSGDKPDDTPGPYDWMSRDLPFDWINPKWRNEP